ncbi:MAG: HEAT repeat domain-containing protein [Acidobacteriota bacterium]
MIFRVRLQNHSKLTVTSASIVFAVVLTVLIGSTLITTAQNNRSPERFTNNLLNKFSAEQDGNASDPAAKSLRVGRELIEDEKWEEAAENFIAFVNAYPRHKSVDAALYWQAFALKKQGRFADADRTLERLIKEHPKSNWKDDAEALRLEIAPQLGNQTTIDRAINDQQDEELKIIALQSLIMSNPERAMPTIEELLKPDSKASKNLKRMALTLLAQRGGARATDLLLNVIRNQQDKELRSTAIMWLGMTGDDRAFDFLKETLTQGTDNELMNAAIVAVSQSRNPKARALLLEIARSNTSPEIRKTAIVHLGIGGGDAAFDELLTLYNAEADVEIKKQILTAFAMHGGARSQAKLQEIVRNETNTEIRKMAVFWFLQRGGDGAVDSIIQLYDTEKSDEVKEQILFALSQSQNKRAVQKLIEIAKTSPSVELRKRAVMWLGQSRDPEARKFIEDILK